MLHSEMLRRQSGSIVLYVMAIIAVVSVLCISISTTITNLQKQVANTKHSTDNSFNLSQIATLVKRHNGLAESAGVTGNENLLACLNGGTTPTCTSNCCNGGVVYGFSYVDPADTNTNLNLKAKLFGTQASPIYYNHNNTPCTPNPATGVNTCAYKIWGEFTAACPGGVATCDQAEHLRVTVNLNYEAANFEGKVLPKDKSFSVIYFNSRNYQPIVNPISSIDLYLGDGVDKDVVVSGNSGNPSEIQNFIFTKCASENTGIMQVTTPPDQPFSGGSATIKLKPISAGQTKLLLQINDGGLENNISKEYSVLVNVFAGSTP